MLAIDTAFERNAALINASEKWATGFHKNPEQFGRLLKCAARLERKLLLFFKEQARTSDRFIDWYAYAAALQEVKASQITAYDVNVIVTNDVSDDNSEFISVVFDEVATAMGLGAQAAEATYQYPLGLDKTSASIQRQARKQVAELVGRRVLDDGTVITNPNPSYAISNTTRKKIQESIHTSLMLGEDIPTATKRLQNVIKDPRRAALIARQETAMAYTSGVHHYGQASGAIGKEWTDNGAVDVCKTNTIAGPIPFNQPYPGGVQHPTQHIGCRCYERLIYQNELDANPKLFKQPKPVAPKSAVSKLPQVASFVKQGKTYTYELNAVEQKVITENKISMTTGPAPGRSRWPKATHGMYVETMTSKSMHIRDPATATARQTFYHEIGHAIDHNLEAIGLTDRYANTSTRAVKWQEAYAKDGNRIFRQRVIDTYTERGLNPKQIAQVLRGEMVLYTKVVNGQTVQRGATINSSWQRYATSPSEVFAHGYGYYRTNPELLKTTAPTMFEFFDKELTP